MLEICATKKTSKNLPPKSRQKDQHFVKHGPTFRGKKVPEIIKNHKFAKMDPKDVQGSKRHPKGTQKAPKRHPQSIQKASKNHPKDVQINQNKIPLESKL